MNQAPNYPNFTQLLTELKQDGASNDEIMAVVQNINNIASAKFYAELLTAFTKEEIAAINTQAQNQEDADNRIQDEFFKKTNKSAAEVKDSFIDAAAQAYLEDYHQKKTALV